MKERRDEFQLSRRQSKSAAAPRLSPDNRGADEFQGEETATLPPRRVKYPSNKHQTARWFYNALIVLFLALMAGLFILGQSMYGDG